ncbi:hypothetical protein [Aquimarina sediminis]|nr:hypothetical protein [Aquimarina sediminis]
MGFGWDGLRAYDYQGLLTADDYMYFAWDGLIKYTLDNIKPSQQ